MFPKLNKQRGFSVISVIIIAAFAYASLTAYSYYNPSFNLSRYTPVYFLGNFNDEQRKEDLNKIAMALDGYFEENRDLPGGKESCGRIFSIVNPTAKNALRPYFPNGIPQDPATAGTHTDYFYRKVDRDTYILMAVLENPKTSETFSFEGCHDWPGNGVYNYLITNQ